jgi:flagellar protein FlgJ
MSSSAVTPSNYADFSGLTALKTGARANDPGAIRETARQFESLLTRMLLKSMREAHLGEGMGDSDETQFYQDMYDQQLAVTMSQGEGIGLASRLLEQLMRGSPSAESAAATTPTAEAPIASAGGVSSDQQQQFIDAMRPAAVRAGADLGIAPEHIIAQAALETGWGTALPADARGSSLNYFGIKAAAGSDQVRATTTEYVQAGAQTLAQPFRRYSSIGDSVADYAQLIGGNERYAAVRNTGNDAQAFASALHKGGYATDPHYVEKLVATAATVRQQFAAGAFKAADTRPI